MSAAQDTAERILDAAVELFGTHGYAGTSTRAIAERADVNEVTLFRRFGSKQGILRALGERLKAAQAGHAAAAAPDSESARETLRRLAHMEVAITREGGALAMRLAFDAQSVPEVREVLGETAPSNLEGLAEYLAERQQAGEVRADVDPRLLAEAFFGMTSSYVMYRMVMGLGGTLEDSDEAVDQLFEVFWSGAQAKGERR